MTFRTLSPWIGVSLILLGLFVSLSLMQTTGEIAVIGHNLVIAGAIVVAGAIIASAISENERRG